MIFKVLYQKNLSTVPTRESTDTLYVEADSELEVRSKLADRKLNIELIQSLSNAHLAYEQKSDTFEVENL